MDFQELFNHIKKTAIITHYLPAEKEIPDGKSKFGGQPYLPEDFAWPYYEGTDFNNVCQKRPLSFLAQINLEETAGYDKDHQLPHKGMLYFFYDLHTMKWGFDQNDKGCAKVIYIENPCDLHTAGFPGDLEEDYRLPEFALSFSNQTDLPDYEEIAEYAAGLDWNSYDKEKALYGYDKPDERISKLLGYADLIQGSMLLECEQATNGIYCGAIPSVTEKQREELLHSSKEWTLLFQMPTVETDDFELMFGDCGSIYFYIRKQDLQAGNFDNVWLILQCF